MVLPERRRAAAGSGRTVPAARPRPRMMTLLLVATLGLLGAATPPPSEAWLDVAAESRTVVVHRFGDAADAVIHLSIRNLLDRPVRVERARAVYLAADRVLGSHGDRERTFLQSALVELPMRIARAERVPWRGLCLEGVPQGADRVRIELELEHRRGLRREARTQSVDVRLEDAPPAVTLELPFKGPWRVTQGHGCRSDHRLGGKGGDFAWDLVAVGEPGLPAPSGPERVWRNRDLPTWGRPILAPADGRVVRVVRDEADNEGLGDYPRRTFLDDLSQPDWRFGNYVVLDLGVGVYVLLAHLQRGSVSVEPGRTVRVGDVLARAGNSGNTNFPHLHLQVMDRADATDPEVRGLPARFADYREYQIVAGREHTDLFARRVAIGDPPEGAVVAPIEEAERAPVSAPSD